MANFTKRIVRTRLFYLCYMSGWALDFENLGRISNIGVLWGRSCYLD